MRQMSKSLLSPLVALALALPLAGCALSPQLITIAPDLTSGSADLGHNQAVQVSVIDQRNQQAFGTRGGVYKETSLIRAENDMPAAVTEALKKELQSRGYNAYNPGAGARQLEVRIMTLEYIPEAGSVVNSVRINTVLRATASGKAEGEYSGIYKTSNDFQQPLTPTVKQNQRMINEELNRALDKLMADPALHAYLGG